MGSELDDDGACIHERRVHQCASQFSSLLRSSTLGKASILATTDMERRLGTQRRPSQQCMNERASIEDSCLFLSCGKTYVMNFMKDLETNQCWIWESIVQVDLSGGFYDAGDNVKFGFPMAYTIALLGWDVVEFGNELRAAGHLEHALNNIRWGTDYLLKAYTGPNELWVQVSSNQEINLLHKNICQIHS